MFKGFLTFRGLKYPNRVLPYVRFLFLNVLSYSPYVSRFGVSDDEQGPRDLHITRPDALDTLVLDYSKLDSQGFYRIEPVLNIFTDTAPLVLFFSYVTKQQIDSFNDPDISSFINVSQVPSWSTTVLIQRLEKLLVKIYERHNFVRSYESSLRRKLTPFILVSKQTFGNNVILPSLLVTNNLSGRFKFNGVRWRLEIPQDYNVYYNNQDIDKDYEDILYIIIYSVFDFRSIYPRLVQAQSTDSPVARYISQDDGYNRVSFKPAPVPIAIVPITGGILRHKGVSLSFDYTLFTRTPS